VPRDRPREGVPFHCAPLYRDADALIAEQVRTERTLWLSYWCDVHYNSLYTVEGDDISAEIVTYTHVARSPCRERKSTHTYSAALSSPSSRCLQSPMSQFSTLLLFIAHSNVFARNGSNLHLSNRAQRSYTSFTTMYSSLRTGAILSPLAWAGFGTSSTFAPVLLLLRPD
jgi:hypothetical protein